MYVRACSKISFTVEKISFILKKKLKKKKEKHLTAVLATPQICT
jgi:hypothetical protein